MARTALSAFAAATLLVTAAAPASASASGLIVAAPSLLETVANRLSGKRARPEQTVYFGFDLDTLDQAARLRLQKEAEYIRTRPGATFAVTGHTDRVGNLSYNHNLGMRRAERVVAYLVTLGVRRGQLRAMVSYGEEKPAIETENRERLNRRVTISLLVPAKSRAKLPEPSTGDRAAVRVQTPPSETPEPPVTEPETPSAEPEPTPSEDPPDTKGKGGKTNSGRGNGDEPAGDPGKSGGKNNGGDEVD